MEKIRIKILSWKIFITIENTGIYFIKDILSPWHSWYPQKKLNSQLCKFYPLKDVFQLDDKGECIKKNFGIESLKDCYWYSSIASTFNDIADCNPELLSISHIRKHFKSYKESTLGNNVGVISIDDFKQMLIKEQLKVFNENFGITCFSHTKNIKNHLMWAHYADEHKGVCFKFKPPELFSERMLLPVMYVWRKPKILLGDVIHFLPIVKSVCWKYEKEVRLISFRIKKEQRKINFNPSQVSEIYFGVRFEKNERKQEILEIINDRYPKANLFQMYLNNKSVRLRSKQVSLEFDNEKYKLQ